MTKRERKPRKPIIFRGEDYKNYIKHRMEHNKVSFRVYLFLRALIILTFIRQVYTHSYENAMYCLLSLLLFLVPSFMEERFRIEIPPVFEIIIYVFIYAAEILGEINNFYTAIPGWDTMLHTINGFLCAAIGFSLVDLLNRHSTQIKLSPEYLAVVAFCFSMTIGVLWEFIEVFADMYLGQDMQKDFIITAFQSVTLDGTNSQIPIAVKDITRTVIETASGISYTIEGGYLDIGLRDTMKDLFVNFIGAVVFSIIGWRYAAGRTKLQSNATRIAEGLRIKVAKDQKEEVPESDFNKK